MHPRIEKRVRKLGAICSGPIWPFVLGHTCPRPISRGPIFPGPICPETSGSGIKMQNPAPNPLQLQTKLFLPMAKTHSLFRGPHHRSLIRLTYKTSPGRR